MKVYVVFQSCDQNNGAGFVLAVFDDFTKARKCAISVVDYGMSDLGDIRVGSFNTETGDFDCEWDYEELLVMEV